MSYMKKLLLCCSLVFCMQHTDPGAINSRAISPSTILPNIISSHTELYHTNDHINIDQRLTTAHTQLFENAIEVDETNHNEYVNTSMLESSNTLPTNTLPDITVEREDGLHDGTHHVAVGENRKTYTNGSTQTQLLNRNAYTQLHRPSICCIEYTHRRLCGICIAMIFTGMILIVIIFPLLSAGRFADALMNFWNYFRWANKDK